MAPHLSSLLQRKFKIILLGILLLVVSIHMVDLMLPSGHGACDYTPKVMDSMGISSPNTVLPVQNKPNLRILQDFSGSNSSLDKGFHSPEGLPPEGSKSNAASKDHSSKQQEAKEKPTWTGKSKLLALFDHPLYKVPTPKVTKKDKLFVKKPKVKLYVKSSGHDER